MRPEHDSRKLEMESEPDLQAQGLQAVVVRQRLGEVLHPGRSEVIVLQPRYAWVGQR